MGVFYAFLNCKDGTKSRKAFQIINGEAELLYNWLKLNTSEAGVFKHWHFYFLVRGKS